ncbi:MAG: cyclic nucleotide-binding domain-containing protein [Pseudomonadota bacterium]
MSPLEIFEADVAATVSAISLEEWSGVKASVREMHWSAGESIYGQHLIGDRWLFVTKGVVASEQSHSDGSHSIARFFERGQFCANLTSTWMKEFATDDLIAITDVAGVELPDQFFRENYLHGGPLGEYLRHKLMETLCFDKEMIVAKTIGLTEVRYRVLEDLHEQVIGLTRKKEVASFLGITPQGLSRFLRNRASGT